MDFNFISLEFVRIAFNFFANHRTKKMGDNGKRGKRKSTRMQIRKERQKKRNYKTDRKNNNNNLNTKHCANG